MVTVKLLLRLLISTVHEPDNPKPVIPWVLEYVLCVRCSQAREDRKVNHMQFLPSKGLCHLLKR